MYIHAHGVQNIYILCKLLVPSDFIYQHLEFACNLCSLRFDKY